MTDGFTLKQVYELRGEVTHNAPCVPECPVCHPNTAPDEAFAMFGISKDEK